MDSYKHNQLNKASATESLLHSSWELHMSLLLMSLGSMSPGGTGLRQLSLQDMIQLGKLGPDFDGTLFHISIVH